MIIDDVYVYNFNLDFLGVCRYSVYFLNMLKRIYLSKALYIYQIKLKSFKNVNVRVYLNRRTLPCNIILNLERQVLVVKIHLQVVLNPIPQCYDLDQFVFL